ncbi:TPA: hypothetical protein ORS30_000763 [Escherichia coli]|uniref:hypothetical protein n=1 Tax=Escherichia coli TaxID=562 RepID=UPI00156BEF34|nr:hypothetical protein [Escherichia coli]MDN7392697.1 hypothetical protein [Escherichia coli]HCS4492218.1 hypothetical protein [Escherichia coli]HCS5424242.1 hypothetical protein [Escherichia coli]HCS5432924.1 hypothetical protein [Escherichia coli]
MMSLSATGYTLLCCCFLSGLYTLIKTTGQAVWRILCFAFPSVGILLLCVCAVALNAVEDTYHC